MDKKSLLAKIKQLEGLTEEERSGLLEILNTKINYGLIWEDKREDVEEELRTKLPVLREVVERRILSESVLSEIKNHKIKSIETQQSNLFSDDEETENSEITSSNSQPAPNHILIEGDNLHVLTALTFTHEGQIDVIYIDPPYNTGNKDDFKYNDRYVDKEDSFRHSKWLSFMSKRLEIAKTLLKSDGVIFCSIGDDEISQLTLLMNKIFTENNKLGVITRLAKPADDQGNYFSSSKDYIIAFTKNIKLLANFKDSVNESLFKKIETEGHKKGERFRDDVALYQASLGVRPNLRYYIQCPDGSLVIPPGNTFPEEKKDGSQSIPQSDEDKCWRWSQDKYFSDKHLIVYKKSNKTPLVDEFGNQGKWNIYTKSYLNDRSEKGASPRDFVDQFINRKGADLIKHYDIKFSYSKPYELIQHLIKITNKPNNINVLDFFAGSGTALQAVLSLNDLDKGTRKCIITTNNENNICNEVTYPRCHRNILPYINSKGNEMPFFPNNNLRYYRTELISAQKTEQNKRLLTLASTELLQIKEDCYTDITSENGFDSLLCKLFTNERGKYVVVVFHSRKQLVVIELLVEWIKSLTDISEKIRLYAFSPEKETLVADFWEVADIIEAVPLPEAIFNAYRATFRAIKLNRKPAQITDESLNEQTSEE